MKKVILLSNITTNLIAAKLKRRYQVVIPDGYDTWVQEVLRGDSFLYRDSADAVLVLLDGYEAALWKTDGEAEERMALWLDALEILAERISEQPVFVSTIDFCVNRIRALSEKSPYYALQNRWYEGLAVLRSEHPNVYVMDLADLIRDVGRLHFYSEKIWYMSGMPYSREGLSAVALFLQEILDSAFAPRRKMVVTDLDNTLWGGVVGEDGLQGIELSDHKEGQRYYDFQRQLLEMKKRGIVLGINSKNNPADAEEVLRNHPSMLLREEDFVIRKVNWQNKVSNIREISDELNLTEGGLIFIDDNPVEREQVKGECPEVLVPDFPDDSCQLKQFAEDLWMREMRPLSILKEDADKTLLYQTEAARKRDRKNALNLDDYIAKLQIRIVMHTAVPEEFDRVAQLCNKTNQFNLTTKRYTRAEIEAFAKAEDTTVYTVSASDRYGDNGLIAVLIMKESEQTGEVRIDSFLMSCRVMGRRIEDVVIALAAKRFAGYRVILADYYQTAKNEPVKDLYEKLGFSVCREEDGHKEYSAKPAEVMALPEGLFSEILFEGKKQSGICVTE